MTKTKKVIIFILILTAIGGLAGVGIYNASQKEDSSGIPRNAIPVHFEHAHRQTITSRVSAKGSVELLDRVTVYPSTQAQIDRVHVRVGDEVHIGDLLVNYDPKTLEAYQDQLAEALLALKSAELAIEAAKIPPTRMERQQAETAIRQAEKIITDIEAQAKQIELSIEQLSANIETAEKRAADAQTLFVMGVATQMELDGAKDAVTALQSQHETLHLQLETVLSGIPMAEENVQLAEAQYATLRNRVNDPRTQNQIKTLEVNIEQINLRLDMIHKNINDFKHAEYAEASGTVLMLYTVEGDIAMNGKPLMEIADTSQGNLVIRINIPENDAKNIELGQPTEIKGAALSTAGYEGYVSKIHPLAERKPIGNSLETVLTVEIAPKESDINIRAGYSIDAVITTGVQENVLVVPLMSTMSDPDEGHFVYIINDDFTVGKKLITIGEYSGLYVQADGVDETDKIILNPSNQIREGVFVRPVGGTNP
jgi:multidrug efflux pump subunit AcrA (membrane-fusion protein)